jgi:sialate O-acetylesterase
MVLPASKEFPVAGAADAGEKVTVRLGGKTFVAVASDSGKWKVIAGPFKPGPGGNLEISTKAKKLVFKDIAFGEIWLCSGQSNMAFRINEEADGGVSSIKETIGGDIRLFDMKPRWTAFHTQWDAAVIDSVRRLEYFNKAVWEKANEENIALFSAVAWHFGKKLSDAIGVPVGLICNAVGGSTTESWVSREYLENDFPAILRNWMDNDLIMEWARNCAKLNLKSGKDLPGTYKRHPYEPCYLYEAGLMPLENYPISGVIWYQGESNAERCFAHERLFPMLVGSWREFFGKDDLPFYYVQLSSINRPCWPVFRNSQRLLKDKLENVGMAVSSDLGDPYDVHPKVKKPIGERLARLALHGVYGYSDLVCSGPEIRSAVYKDGKVVCSFDSAQGLCTSDGKPLRELELYNGKDGLWHEVEAELCEDGKLIVDLGGKTLGRSPAIRYAWKPYSEGNLVNAEGLPASTFELEIVVDN